jgi:hypothetical protein
MRRLVLVALFVAYLVDCCQRRTMKSLDSWCTCILGFLEEHNEEVHLQWVDVYILQVKLEIMAQIQKVNRKAISNAQKVNNAILDFHR